MPKTKAKIINEIVGTLPTMAWLLGASSLWGVAGAGDGGEPVWSGCHKRL